MNTQMKDEKDIEEKSVYAPLGETVFTHAGKGTWEASLYDTPVLLERVEHNLWKCINQEDNQVLGEGTTRSEAMREAFYEMAREHGYSPKEAKRLAWILVEQRYRSYGGHKPRKSTKGAKDSTNGNVIALDTQRQAQKSHCDGIIDNMVCALKGYKTAYNKTFGGWMFYKRNSDGKIEGDIEGPYPTEEDMAEAILEDIRHG